MAIRTYKVTLDSKNTIAPEPVFLRQGDKTGAVVIDATLTDNGYPVSLSGLTPMFKANTADGQAVIADSTGFDIVNASGGEFTYQVPSALSAVPGKIKTAYFSFSDSSGSESTFDVAFIIKKAVDATQAQADDYITIVDGTLKTLQQKIDAMNTDVQTILDAFNQGDFYSKAQTDDKDAATLASAKDYADSKDAATIASAKDYADSAKSSLLTMIQNADRKKTIIIGNGSITGYKSGAVQLTRYGKLVIAKMVVQLGQMSNGQNIFPTPNGFHISGEGFDMHFALAGGLEIALNGTGFYSAAQVADGRWWSGTCVYFTDDDWPA